MRPWLAGLAANASSLHAPGRAARAAVEGARERIATLLGVRSEELVFTSGGTESDALAVCGGARAARDGEPLRTRVAYSAAEHAAVREAARSLRREGFEPLELPVDGAGLPRQDGLAAANDGRTALLSLILAGNETGTLNGAIAESAASSDIYSILKREDEKYITEKSYGNPMFVEDMVRSAAERLLKNERILWFSVESENMESIHNHSAYARIEMDLNRE